MARKTSLARSAAGLARYYMDCGWWRHPRNVGLDLAAIGLYACIVGACNEQATNGDLPADHELVAAMVGLRASKVRKPLQQLIDAGRLEHAGTTALHVVGFSDHNPTAEEIDDYIEERSRQGTRGNHIRHHVNKGVVKDDCEFCSESRPARSSDPPSDPEAIAPASPEGVANSSHGMGWDGMGTTQVVSPTGGDPPPDPTDDAPKPFVRLVAEARARRVYPGQTTSEALLTSIIRDLDAQACERLRRQHKTPAEIELALDGKPKSAPASTGAVEQRRPPLIAVRDLDQLTDQPAKDRRRNLDGITAARAAAAGHTEDR